MKFCPETESRFELIVTDHVHSTGEGNVFTGVCLLTGEGEGQGTGWDTSCPGPVRTVAVQIWVGGGGLHPVLVLSGQVLSRSCTEGGREG